MVYYLHGCIDVTLSSCMGYQKEMEMLAQKTYLRERAEFLQSPKCNRLRMPVKTP